MWQAWGDVGWLASWKGEAEFEEGTDWLLFQTGERLAPSLNLSILLYTKITPFQQRCTMYHPSPKHETKRCDKDLSEV